ncbi:hypothetical protein ACFOY2_20765 [Nonomuraea purpurea]|uniref:GH26 domain-containing protein n=1 Tax=Nonomuraea purpurea TaxID=1849276 RepID=A0ABV8GBI7_9ACTN
MLAGVLVLAGGVAAVLGANGTFSVPTAPEVAAGTPGPEVVAEAGNRAAALPEAAPNASTQARPRSAEQSEPPKQPSSEPVQAAGTVEPGLVAGATDPDAVLAEGPDPGDIAGYKADGPSRHTDLRAADYFHTHWGAGDKAVKRLKDIRTVGGYLRIYTDLPETAGNSRTALTLCERGLAYLRAAGVANPVVFVQAEFGENGNPVLANILGPTDTTCRVTHPAPG